MNKIVRFSPLLVAALLLGGCTAKVATPWDRNALDPGQITTMKPLEIPPDFDTLPEPGGKAGRSQESAPQWVDSGEQGASDGEVPSLFKIPAAPAEAEDLSRNEKEQLPSWVGPEIQSE
jgi:hypothetical protein